VATSGSRDLINMQIRGRGLHIKHFQEVVTYLLCQLVVRQKKVAKRGIRDLVTMQITNNGQISNVE
jgi:hypothetical protein